MGLPKIEKYNQERIEKLFKYLQTYADRGQPIEYEIKVDDFSAVRRTDDTSLFHGFSDFMSGDTKNIEIIFYSPTGHYDKYIFTMKEEVKESLSGLEIEHKIKDHVSKARQEWELKDVIKERDELKEKVKDLEEELDEIKSNKSPVQVMLGEFMSGFVSNMVRTNPKIAQKFPALAGLVEANPKTIQEDSGEKPSFEPSKESTLDPEAKEALDLVRFLKSKLSEVQFAQTMSILDLLCAKPEKVETIFNELNS